MKAGHKTKETNDLPKSIMQSRVYFGLWIFGITMCKTVAYGNIKKWEEQQTCSLTSDISVPWARKYRQRTIQ
uniref:Uncharacterized protein n=1 Tax=Ditylenchus dipsaci TaxID=166011 RepID=A0A915DT63_9BILA